MNRYCPGTGLPGIPKPFASIESENATNDTAGNNPNAHNAEHLKHVDRSVHDCHLAVKPKSRTVLFTAYGSSSHAMPAVLLATIIESANAPISLTK